MSNINQLVFEDFSRPETSFYDSKSDNDRKISGGTDIENVQKFLDGKLDSSSKEDEIKSNKASTITGMSSGITHPLQKLSSNFGGINKVLNKPDINVDMKLAESEKMKKIAIKSFNRAMGEKVL